MISWNIQVVISISSRTFWSMIYGFFYTLHLFCFSFQYLFSLLVMSSFSTFNWSKPIICNLTSLLYQCTTYRYYKRFVYLTTLLYYPLWIMCKSTCVYMDRLCIYVLNMSPLADILVFPNDENIMLAYKLHLKDFSGRKLCRIKRWNL